MSEIPNDVSEKIKQTIGWYSLTLVRVQRDRSTENIFGSGTLVSIDEEWGILTAGHVAQELKTMDEVGLCISPNPHRLTFRTQHLSILDVGWRGRTTSEGPDISIVCLPPTEIGMIKAYKSFYPLDPRSNDTPTSEFSPDGERWFISGYIGTWTTHSSSGLGFAGTHGFRPFIGIAENIQDYAVRENFDYCNIIVQYESNSGSPRNFEGLSGGGFWKAKLRRKKDDGILYVDDVILHGLAYYQTSIEDNTRKIVCHAHRSILTRRLDGAQISGKKGHRKRIDK